MTGRNIIRRRYLGGVAAGAISVIAGCSGDGDNGDNQDHENDSNMNSSTDGTTQQRDVDVVIDSAEWGDENSVELFIENNGQDRSGTISITAKWFDEQRNFLDYENLGVRSLGGGETWWFWFEPSVEWYQVDEFELFLEYDSSGLSVPENMALGQAELGNDLALTGIVENDRSQQSSVELVVPIYGENGRMLYAYSTSQDGIPANTDWRFILPIQGYERTSIADYEVLLHSPST